MKKTLQLLILLFTFTFTFTNAQDITSGLVFHLTGNETITNGTLTSSDASSTSGIIVDTDSNVATITHTTGADGSANGAIDIPKGSFIQFAAADITDLPIGRIGNGRTYSAWVKSTTIGDADDGLLFGNVISYGNKEDGKHVHFQLEKNGTQVKAGHWSYDMTFKNLPNYADGTWHHLAYTVYQGTTFPEAELFIDGQSQGVLEQADNDGTIINTDITGVLKNFTIGQRNEGATDSKDLVGELDDIRIYNRALTTEEIETLFANKGTNLSVDDIEKNSAFKVSLTESNILKVVSNLEIEKLSIVNLNGAIIKNIKANESIDVSELSNGIYIVMIQSKNENSIVKFIKQ